ncbi:MULTISPECIES: hypothetical protein [Bradyrhizobium]|uniref:hypothetical protein n=1 Tax=Bradyrhizobium pachyrhizi TaxID=280333 RepID=UPI000403E1E5
MPGLVTDDPDSGVALDVRIDRRRKQGCIKGATVGGVAGHMAGMANLALRLDA